MNTNNINLFAPLIGLEIPPIFAMSETWTEALCEIDGCDEAPNFYGLAWPGRDGHEDGFPIHAEIMFQLDKLHLDLDEAVGSVFTYRPYVGAASASCLTLIIELDLDGSLMVIDADIETGHSEDLELTVGLSHPAAALSMYRSLKYYGVLNPPMPMGVSDDALSEIIVSSADTLRAGGFSPSIENGGSIIDDINGLSELSIAANRRPLAA